MEKHENSKPFSLKAFFHTKVKRSKEAGVSKKFKAKEQD